MKTFIIIPAYNEEQTVNELVRRAAGQADTIVVDDGSSDQTPEIARAAGAEVISHVVNRGLGAALATGIAAALARGAEAIVTLDADLQHDPEEAPRLLAPIAAREADIVIGSRLLSLSIPLHPSPPVSSPMPWYRRLQNRTGNLVTYLLFGIRCTDTQSGFRAFSRRAAEMIQIQTDGMEVSSEILQQAHRHGLRIAEVPITARYSRYSLSKGQNMVVGFRTAWKLFLQRMKT